MVNSKADVYDYCLGLVEGIMVGSGPDGWQYMHDLYFKPLALLIKDISEGSIL